MSVGFPWSWPWLCNTTQSPLPYPAIAATEHWPPSLLLAGGGACSFFAPHLALGQCWLRGLYTLTLHTHTHTGHATPGPAPPPHGALGASRLRHVVWMVMPRWRRGSAPFAWVGGSGSPFVLLAFAPRRLGPHTCNHNKLTPLALAALARGWAQAALVLSGQQPARPYVFVGHEPFVVLLGGDVPPLVFHPHATQRTLHPT